jgi:sigma-E factor negative regulatory protein RseC
LKLLSEKAVLGRQFQPVILSRLVDMPVRVVSFEGGLKK